MTILFYFIIDKKRSRRKCHVLRIGIEYFYFSYIIASNMEEQLQEGQPQPQPQPNEGKIMQSVELTVCVLIIPIIHKAEIAQRRWIAIGKLVNF